MTRALAESHPELLLAIAFFMELHPELETMEGASGMCAAISGELLDFLERSLPDWPGDMSFVQWWYEYDEDTLIERDLVEPHGFYWNNGHDGHTAARIGDWVIDLTARQFGDDVPFPLVWHCSWTSDQFEQALLEEGVA